MKRKTLIIFLFILITTCGCSVNYDLTIDSNNNYYETTTIESSGNEDMSKELLYANYEFEYPIYESQEFVYYNPTEKKDDYTYYDKSISENLYGYRAVYKANYDNDSYKDARMLVNSFKKISIGYNANEEYYYLNLNDLKIFNYENYITNINVTINVADNYVVINNNAQNISGNSYKWNFNNENASLILMYQKKDIYNKNNSVIVEPEDNKKDNGLLWIVGIILVFVYLLAIVLVTRLKNRK